MSLTGWLTMIVSIGGVLAAAAWAYYKVLSTPKETEHLGSPTPPMPEDAGVNSAPLTGKPQNLPFRSGNR